MQGYYVNTSYGNDTEYNEEICDTIDEAKKICDERFLPYCAIKYHAK